MCQKAFFKLPPPFGVLRPSPARRNCARSTGGGCAALGYCGGFLRSFLPLEKGELEGVVEEIKAKN